MDRDKVLEKILHAVGDNGRYQNLLICFFFVPICFVTPWTVLVQIFQASIPDHWCHVAGRPDFLSVEQWKNMTIPWSEKHGKISFSKCKQLATIQQFETIHNDSMDTIACQMGWDYNHTWYDKTLPMDQNWVCERDSNSARWLAAGLAGKVVGTFIFTCLADYYGRKLLTIVMTQFYAIFGICRLYMTSEWGLLMVMFLSCMVFPAILEVSWVWVIEQASGDIRSRITTINFLMWTAGGCVIPLLAWWTRDWVLLGLLTSLPFVPFFLLWWIFPESPRWLLSRGRAKESFQAFKRIAKINGKTCPDDLEETLEKLLVADERPKNMFESFSFVELLKYPVVRKRTLILSAVYTCNVLMYYGIIYNSSNISGNEFLNFFYLTLSELPGNLLGWLSSEQVGRRMTETGFFFLATLTSVVIVFVSLMDSWMEIFFLVICKILINVCFLVIYMQIAEILPTSHRASGLGFCSIVSAIVGISAPYIAYSSSYWSALPYLIVVLIGVFGTIASVFLPETLGESLPQTMVDAEKFLTDQSFWSYTGWRPCRKAESVEEPSASTSE